MEINEIIKQLNFTNERWILLLPVILMAFDIFTGLFHAWATGHLKSFKMREGLNHKVGEISVLLIGEIFTIALQLPRLFIVGISFYVILMELISICENLDKMGVKIPKFIKKAFRNAMNKIQEGDLKENKKEDDDNDSVQ